ncbi:MAG TPA: cobalamin-independent methionine synthase II family protein [Steroidobacteraceae bacterium]|nr:cobalamin-independent methionine synthase II family protein [Steroidobacteraceae bacterium]
MKRSSDRILTTHVGSIIRPEALLALGSQVNGPPKDRAAYEAALREAVADVVRRQVAAGIDIVNDGEYGKSSWANYVLERIKGFETREGRFDPRDWLGRERERFPEMIEAEFGTYVKRPIQACVAPIDYHALDAVKRDAKNLNDALSASGASEGFLTAVAPASAAFNAVDDFYHDERKYIMAMAEALRQEYLEVYRAGLIVQVDDAVLANMYDHLMQKSPQDYRKWAQLRIDALIHALRGIPSDRVRYHVCFGSWHLPHTVDAPLEDIIDLILQVPADAYSLEAANPRHEHEWRVWERVKLPPGKILIPGVITHHIVTVEHPRVIADRIVRFARIVGRENVIAGSDCGFAQQESIRRVHPKVMWAKFEALAAGARLATAELWGRAAA